MNQAIGTIPSARKHKDVRFLHSGAFLVSVCYIETNVGRLYAPGFYHRAYHNVIGSKPKKREI